MERKIENKILEILNSNKLPIFLLGARQVGKTYIVKHIANKYYSNKYIYVNLLDHNELYNQINKLNSPSKIIDLLEYHFKTKIESDWLIIFDEIQEVPSLKTAIKNFIEEEYKNKIICLGSYLGNLMLNDNFSFPVGKVITLEMFPMDFEEFLIATNNQKYIDLIKLMLKTRKPLDDSDHQILIQLLYDYYLIGGMPQSIFSYIETHNFKESNAIKKELFNNYRNDILKYSGSKTNKAKSLIIYDSIPLFLSKINKKYKLSNVETGMKYLNSQLAIKSLLISKIIYKINNLSKLCEPLITKQKENEFKIYYNDVGFTSYVFNLNKTILLDKQNKYANERGAVSENYVISQIAMKTNQLFYYSFRGNENKIDKPEDKNNSNTEYEIDLCLEDDHANIIPIEIKFGDKFRKKSIKKLMIENNFKYGILFSNKNFSYDSELRIFNIPLYCVCFLEFNFDRLVSFSK